MGRLHLLDIVNSYRDLWLSEAARHMSFDAAEEEAILSKFKEFVASTPDCFERTSVQGHVTGSALVVSPDLEQVLLTLHGKLNLWLQLGGHADGNPRVHEVAWREAVEESGIRDVRFLEYEAPLALATPNVRSLEAPLPIDFDCHDIPARKNEPTHIHYDVRYVLVADPKVPLVITDESKDLRWFTLAEARQVTSERSMVRQFDKLARLKTLFSDSGLTGQTAALR